MKGGKRVQAETCEEREWGRGKSKAQNTTIFDCFLFAPPPPPRPPNAFGTHWAEVDASCCHLRFLRKRLKNCKIGDAQSFPIILLSTEYYHAWRWCLSQYLDKPLDDAKTELFGSSMVEHPVSMHPSSPSYARRSRRQQQLPLDHRWREL